MAEHSQDASEPPVHKPFFRCPCCHFRTLYERSADEICQVCFWQDDGQGDQDANEVRGGPNKHLSLTGARQNFLKLGAADPEWVTKVRPPRDWER